MKKSGFTKGTSFDPKTAIAVMNLKLHRTTCLSLS